MTLKFSLIFFFEGERKNQNTVKLKKDLIIEYLKMICTILKYNIVLFWIST